MQADYSEQVFMIRKREQHGVNSTDSWYSVLLSFGSQYLYSNYNKLIRDIERDILTQTFSYNSQQVKNIYIFA